MMASAETSTSAAASSTTTTTTAAAGKFSFGFQVVLLAGGSGSRMSPLSDTIPKAMLPIANRPLISYQLEFLLKAGFTEVIIVAHHNSTQAITSVVQDVYQGKITTSLVTYKDAHGTAEAMAKVRERIHGHAIIISADLIVDWAILREMVDKHITNSAAITMLLCHRTIPGAQEPGMPAIPDEMFTPKDYIGMDGNGRVVFLAAAADFGEKLHVRKALLRKAASPVMIRSDLYDLHLYILSPNVLDYLVENKGNFSSLKSEFLPHIVKGQFSPTQSAALSATSVPEDNGEEEESGFSQEKIDAAIAEMTHSCPLPPAMCYAVIMPPTSYCTRINTIPAFVEANKQIARGVHTYIPWEERQKNNFISTTADVSLRTQVAADCIVGDGTGIGDRCGIRKTVIGKNCNIADNIRLANTVIMDSVIIKPGCSLTDCVICNNVEIGEGSELRNCYIGVSVRVEPGSKLTNETLTVDD
ncbi:translation initiation factor eIF-2B subunit gamma [Pelomyxa schiedti]|nr:translation initiation factor eIF-2B subunit gamma [Pelomyxa schiedti]